MIPPVISNEVPICAPAKPRTIEVPVLMTPQDFAALTQTSIQTARGIFNGAIKVFGKVVPTVPVGRRRRMAWHTFEKYFLKREA